MIVPKMSVCHVFDEGKRLHRMSLEDLNPLELAKVYVFVLSEYGDSVQAREVEDALADKIWRADLEGENERLSQENSQLETQCDDLESELDELRGEYESLEQDYEKLQNGVD
jgi:hypothetical protein